jgi:hypothetical protein
VGDSTTRLLVSRDTVEECRLRALVALGRTAEALPHLEVLAAGAPIRSSVCELLMDALAAEGNDGAVLPSGRCSSAP